MTSSKTMKVEGLEDIQFCYSLIVDISTELVTSLGLPITKIKEFGVSLGEGNEHGCQTRESS